MDPDDPLDRLAADKDWQRRAREIDRDMAKLVRRERRRQWRHPRRIGRDASGIRAGRGVSWMFLALLTVTVVGGIALWAGAGPAAPAVFVFVLAGWLVTLCLHEFSHALVAHRGGDDTVAGKGYLSLDPRRYGHPILTLVLPLVFLIAGGIPLPGGAVMVERHRLRGRVTDTLVSAAGPAVPTSPPPRCCWGSSRSPARRPSTGWTSRGRRSGPRSPSWRTSRSPRRCSTCARSLGWTGTGWPSPTYPKASAGSAPASGPSEC